MTTDKTPTLPDPILNLIKAAVKAPHGPSCNSMRPVQPRLKTGKPCDCWKEILESLPKEYLARGGES